MFRDRTNWIVIRVHPWPLEELIESTPAMFENSFSRGVATVAAIVSGLAPAKFAKTMIVG